MKKVSVIILAGGENKRMGKPKYGLRYQNKTFLEIAMEKAEKVSDDVIISINERLKTRHRVVEDEIKHIGPIGGIYSCLKEAKYPASLVFPVDMPLISLEFLEFLIDKYSLEEKINTVSIEGKLIPLLGVFSKDSLTTIRNQIKEKDYKLINLIKKTNAKIIEIEQTDFNPDILKNINTPQQFEEL